MLSVLAFLAIYASTIGSVAAQSIDPQSVDQLTRNQWCIAQEAQCPLICTQYPGNSLSTTANDCDPETLAFNCVCAVNGLSPNLSEYSQTIPYFICTENNNDCVDACYGSSACQSDCRENNPCGAQDPKLVNQTSTTVTPTSTGGRSAASTASDGEVFRGFGGSDATTTATADEGATGNAAAILMNVGQLYGLGVVAAGILVGFSILL